MSTTPSDGSDVLVIEDIRTFSFPCVYARTMGAAWQLLFSRPWDQVWFDHDMGMNVGAIDVMPVVRELERRAVMGEKHPINRIYIHSVNPVGRANIAAALGGHYEVRMVSASDYLAVDQPNSPARRR